MKNMITMMIGIVIGAITILIILTVTGRMNYATELESQLPAVVENILCNVMINHKVIFDYLFKSSYMPV